MKDWPKLVFTAAIALVFVISTTAALFGAGQAMNAVLRTYVFGVEDCRYDPKPRPVEEDATSVAPDTEERCEVDYNQTKRSIADGVGMFIIAAPLAGVMFWQTRRMMKD